MTFTEIQDVITDRLDYTSTEADTRVGKEINRVYREITTTVGMQTSRHVAVSQAATIGNREVIFTGVEKLETVYTLTSNSKPVILQQVLVAELRNNAPPDSDQARRFAVRRIGSNSVTIWLDVQPATAITLYADGITEVADLSGTDEPALPESFHDIIVEGVLKDEYQKLEKTPLARQAEERFQRRLSDLRMFIAKNNFLDIYQGKKSTDGGGGIISGGGGAGAGLGSTTLTITSAWTFDRDPSAPFVVTDTSAYVPNLYAEGVGNVTTDRLIGRDTAATGESEQLTVGGGIEFTGSGGIQTSALTGDVTKTAGGTATTIAADAVTDTKLRNSGALSVVGRSANSSGDPADISATAATDAVLRESGSVLGFGTIATAGIANDAVTDAKLRNSGALSIIGRSANSSGDPADISAAAASDSVLRESGSVLGFGTIATAGIANDAVTYAKIQNVSAASRLLGRGSASGSGDTEELTAGTGLEILTTILNVILPGLCNGRLTLTSGNPVTTADVTGATTIYFTPYNGDKVSLFDGSNWKLYTFTERSLALGTLTADLPYDVFLYDNAGTLTLELTAWTNGTTRATALTTQNGVYVKTGATTRLYLGTIRTTSTTQTEDSHAKRFVWNHYNRKRRPMRVLETTDTWVYTAATWRQANASTANQLAVVIGVAGAAVYIEAMASATRNSSAGVTIGTAIGENSTSAFSAASLVGRTTMSLANVGYVNTASLSIFPAVGYSYYAWLEFSVATGVTTWVGDEGAASQSGIIGWVEG